MKKKRKKIDLLGEKLPSNLNFIYVKNWWGILFEKHIIPSGKWCRQGNEPSLSANM